MSKTNKIITVPIKGMHCRSCEILIEDNLKEIKGVDKAELNFRQGQAEIHYSDYEPNMEQISQAVVRAGYTLGTDEGSSLIFSRNRADYKDLGIAAVFLFGLYFLLKGLGINNFNVAASSESLTVPVVLLIGLTAGFSTCMALVGGLVLGISAKHSAKHPEATVTQKIRPHLFFNLGRIVAFALLGGLLGSLGSVFQLSGLALGGLTVLVGVIMLVMGLQLVGIFPFVDSFKLTLPKSLARFLGLNQHQKEYNHRGAMILGALTFFLPCGFTQAMQVYAVASGSFVSGAIIMAAFALGTMPGLLSIGGLTSLMKGVVARRFFRLTGLAIIIFAVFNLSNGLNLLGFGNLAYGQTASVKAADDPNVTMVDGVQVVKMRETNRGYEPNTFTIKKDVPVKWIITAEAPYSCASALIMPKLNIRKNLTAGENIIEFTPTATGKLNFSCTMGMYTGVFNVVDDSGQTQVNNSQPADGQPAVVAGACGVKNSGGGGGCGCGGSGGGCGGNKPFVPAPEAVSTPEEQPSATQARVIRTTYTDSAYLQPNSFKLKAGVPVKFMIDVKDDGVGCGYAIMIPGLYDQATPLQAGQQIVMNFTPKSPGTYQITCGMEMIQYGQITVE